MDTTPKIMVIDDGELDNIIFQLILKRVLHTPNVESCNSGIAAIDRLQLLRDKQSDELPDYIFLDINMPLMNGWEFLKAYSKLKIESSHQSKIYVLSSFIDRSDIEMSQNSPFVQGHLSKPIDVDALKAIFQVN